VKLPSKSFDAKFFVMVSLHSSRFFPISVIPLQFSTWQKRVSSKKSENLQEDS